MRQNNFKTGVTVYNLFIIIGTVLTGCLFSCKSPQKLIGSENSINNSGVFGPPAKIAAFESQLEALRIKYHIPGLSVGIVNGGQLVWKKGFGYSDMDTKQKPDENTVYQIASVSKTFGSILFMQQVQAGRISLEDSIGKYQIKLGARWGSDPRIKLKHLITHTAAGGTFNGFKPGYQFHYNGDWYSRLQQPIEQVTGISFAALMLDSIIRPLHLSNTVPSIDDSVSFALTGYDRGEFRKKIAKPYDWQQHQLQPVTAFRYGFSPAAGLMSTVADLAIYSVAIDQERFLNKETWAQVFTPSVTPRGKTIQYGLGWFVGKYKGLTIHWHTGWWTGYSALFIKVPEKDLTFIVLANSQDLSRPFYKANIGSMLNPFHPNLNKKLKSSAFAKAFLKTVTK